MKSYSVTLMGPAQGHPGQRTVSLTVLAESHAEAIDKAWESEWTLMRRLNSMSVAHEVQIEMPA